MSIYQEKAKECKCCGKHVPIPTILKENNGIIDCSTTFANIIETKYTSGDEFVFSFNYKYYKGDYYELNGQTFAGKEFNVNASELVKANSKEINPLLTSAKTLVYGSLSKVKLNNINVKGVIPPDDHNVNVDLVVFYCKKININPILIKQISEQTYYTLKNDPLYIVTYIGNYKGIDQDINDASKQIPELRDWLTSDQTK